MGERMNFLTEKSKQYKKNDNDISKKFVPLNHNFLGNYPNLQINEDKEIYIFDIDKTLYHSYLVEKCTKKKMMYLQYLMSIGYSTQQACKILMTLRNKYNKIIQGLLEEYELNDHHYNKLIQYDPTKYMNLCSDFDAIDLFSNLEGLKVCFTNACGKHSKFVLEKLGIIDHIDYIFHCDLENKVFNCKPSKEVYQMIEEYLQVKDKNKIHFFDDKLVNIETAKEIGWNAYHVNDDLTYKNILRTYFIDNGKLHVDIE